MFESSNIYPTKESDLQLIPPPVSSYGFKNLQLNILQIAFSQYGLEYSIAVHLTVLYLEVKSTTNKSISENLKKLALGHVVPDLILKV